MPHTLPTKLGNGMSIVRTVGCHCNVVQYSDIMYTALGWQKQSTNRSLNLQKTPHITHVMGCCLLWGFARKQHCLLAHIFSCDQAALWMVLSVLLSVCHTFLAATKQLYEWFSPSVCPSVTPFSPCSHHRIIMKFSGVITNDKSGVHAKGQGQRSRS